MRHSARVNARIRYSKIATCTVLSLNEYSTFSVSPPYRYSRSENKRRKQRKC
ncbi:hypothetical protein T440DRAFT_317467 [Plenodomus tracheiphilus IPT5]|uniref:Uncharacterized protein n=1 Tax=Plenodomus tracheiphilus IPT5 TaxID=1408161 RepID=A0A6A7AQN8_9PLEO|nr:hypothetical protein T440DRAFT_317467 [Plenodomus tracheiphilus IPT5]